MVFDKGLMGGSSALMVLSLLKQRDLYGYQMIQELSWRSDYVFEFKEGTLYPILHKLENQGMITSYLKEGEKGKDRRYYHISQKGTRKLDTEKKQWEIFSDCVNKVIGGTEYGYAFDC